MNSSPRDLGRTDIGSEAWHRDFAVAINDAIARLARVEVGRFDEEIRTVFAEFAAMLDFVVIGESTMAGGGIFWSDPDGISADEVVECGTLLRRCPQPDGPFSAIGAASPILAAPAVSGGFSRFTAGVPRVPESVDGDVVMALELISSIAGAARQRVVTEHQLRSRAETHRLLNEISTQAAVDTADEETLQRMLEVARKHLGVTGARTFMRDGQDLVLVANSGVVEPEPMSLGSRVKVNGLRVLQLSEAGHAVRRIGERNPDPGEPALAEGEILCVPRTTPDGVVGVVVFSDSHPRVWSATEIEAAKSVARSIEQLTGRSEMAREHRHRRSLDRLVSDVASIAAVATLDNLNEVIDDILRMAIETFGIRSAGMWATGPDQSVRMVSRYADGSTTREPTAVPISAAERATLHEKGRGFVRLGDIDLSGFSDEDTLGLVVPIGPGPSGLLVFVGKDRWWSEEDIAACRTLANLADQTRSRLHNDLTVRARLHEEVFSAEVALQMADVDHENLDGRVEQVLRLAVDHFGVAQAALWRYEHGQLTCFSSARDDGLPGTMGTSVSVPDISGLVDRGWMVTRVRNFRTSGIPEADPDNDSRVLIVGFEGEKGVAGALVLTDHQDFWWDDRRISSARAFADTIGHVWMRLQVTARLVMQQEVDEILASVSHELVTTTLDEAQMVVERALERIRARFDLAALSVVESRQPAMNAHCPAEVSATGEPMLRDHFPLPREHPTVTRLLDPNFGPEAHLGDLIDAPGARSHPVMKYSSVNGRDFVLLIATHRPEGRFDPQTRTALESMSGLLAQLRQRLHLEIHARRRIEADRMVAEIARSFVEQPPYDHDRAVIGALSRIGAFFDVRLVSRWRLQPGKAPTPDLWWSHPEHGLARSIGSTPAPVIAAISDAVVEIGASGVREIPAVSAVSPSTTETLAAEQLSKDGTAVATVALLAPHSSHLLVDLDIMRDVLARVARLMEQLLRRADSDLSVARRLRHEDLLRQLATTMVRTDADAVDMVEHAVREFMVEFRIDHASIWHNEADGDQVHVSLSLQAIDGDARLLDAPMSGYTVDREVAEDVVLAGVEDAATTWDLADAPEGIKALMTEASPPGPRQVAFLRAPGNERSGESSFLVFARPGTEAFLGEELECFRSAQSILIQHEARITAERWFSAAFNSAPIGITLRSADHRLIHCNAAYEELVGRAAAELRGTLPSDVALNYPGEPHNESTPDVDGMRQIESAYHRPDGTVRWASVRSSPVRLPGRRDPLVLTYVEDITDRRRNREMLEYQATHDELTGLPNRRALMGEIAIELERPGDCAVLVLDLDRFKVVNDSLGHSVGDQLLVTCADRIRLSLRPDDSVCRLGGDEFAILLRAPADPHSAGIVAERLLHLLREAATIGEDVVYPSASIGVALPQPDDTVEDLLRHADAAMYSAKARGRDGWEVFDVSMRRAVVDRVRTETDLRRAIENGQLEVHYQPEFLLETGEIVGSEALVRWRHPDRGLLAAGSFISLAEETGLVVDLGRWVLAQATVQGARWLQAGHDIITRVNLSARQLRGPVVAEVESALAAAEFPADRLCLELTETAIMDDVHESALILGQFRELGVQVAIDDFGTGFSSLAYLKRFPVDILKIDRTFVDGVGVDPDDTAIVRSVIGLARTLRLEVVAEGIEDATQLDELVRLGCGRGQGFHLARPVPADEVSRLLIENQADQTRGTHE